MKTADTQTIRLEPRDYGFDVKLNDATVGSAVRWHDLVVHIEQWIITYRTNRGVVVTDRLPDEETVREYFHVNAGYIR